MRIENRTRNTVLGSRVVLAATWWSRLRGFLGSHDPLPGEGILLIPCNGVHTYGMSFSIDVLFSIAFTAARFEQFFFWSLHVKCNMPMLTRREIMTRIYC